MAWRAFLHQFTHCFDFRSEILGRTFASPSSIGNILCQKKNKNQVLPSTRLSINLRVGHIQCDLASQIKVCQVSTICDKNITVVITQIVIVPNWDKFIIHDWTINSKRIFSRGEHAVEFNFTTSHSFITSYFE